MFPRLLLIMDFGYTTPFLVIAIAGWLAYTRRAKRSSLPGPPRLPLIGSVHYMPTSSAWLVFSEWNKSYGGIFHLNALGKTLVVINSVKIAKDLLDKRSSIYSDRPRAVMAGDLVGFTKVFALNSYGDTWRKQRRMVSQDFSPNMIPRYYALQEKEAATLVRNLLKDPDTLRDELQFRLGVIITRVTYGFQVQSMDDPMLELGMTAIGNFSKTTMPGKYMVDVIPALRYLPLWMPGAGFLKEAKKMRAQLINAAYKPYELCKHNLDTGKALMPNLCATVIHDANEHPSKEVEENMAWAALSMLGGGLDTNVSAALSYMMAMILHPRIQQKAQMELDTVIGKERLPHISDRPKLPYLRSIMAETLRWAPPVPLGVPHSVTEDDIYEGYHIPKGSIIQANIWHMLHDPDVYPHPMTFNPERFNGDDAAMDSAKELVFGFGRRVCPGIHFAEGTFFAIITTLLATCDILPGINKNGKEVLPEYEYTDETITMPKPFALRLRARSPQAIALLEEASAIHVD